MKIRTSVASTAVAVLAVGAALTSCSGDDSDDPVPFAPLEVAWTQSLQLSGPAGGPLAADGTLLLPDRGEINAVDPATGDTAWTHPVRRLCSMPDRVQEETLVFSWSEDEGRGAKCNRLTALDVSSGEMVWERTVAGTVGATGPVEETMVAVGEETVSARGDSCGEVVRFRLTDGKRLGADDRIGGASCKDLDLAEHWIAEVRTSGGATQFRLVDADTGEVAFRRPAKGMQVHRIHSVDPLVMDVTVDGRRLLRPVDPETGELGTPTGAQWQAVKPPRLLGTQDDVLLVGASYGDHPYGLAPAARMSGFARDGETLWSDFPSFGLFAGDDGRGAVVVNSNLPREHRPDDGVAVTRHRWHDVDDYDVLGTVEQTGTSQVVVGDLLLVQADTGVTAYHLPEDGVAPEEPWRATGQPRWVDDGSEWADDDVRPDDVTDCPVGEDALRALGFHQLDLPKPQGCVWLEEAEPDGVTRKLRVDTHVGVPSESQDAEHEATRHVADLHESWAEDRDELGVSTKVRELSGVGDEAIAVVAAGPGGRQRMVHLAVREGNVVVSVAMTASLTEVSAADAVSPVDLEGGVWQAAQDALAGAGLEISAPDPAPVESESGKTLRAGTDLCSALNDQVGRSGSAHTPDEGERALACTWSGARDHRAQVDLFVTPGSALTKETGDQLARRGVAAATRAQQELNGAGPPREVSGLGQEAWVSTYTSTVTTEGEPVRTRSDVWVRRGSLTIAVSVEQRGGPEETVESQAVRLTRAALATQD